VTTQSFIAIGLITFFVAVSSVDAQSVGTQIPSRIVVSGTAPIFVSPEAGLTPLRVAKEGSALNVIAAEGSWYRVEFQDPQFGRRVGYVEKRHVTPLATERRQEAPADLTVAETRPSPVAATVQEQPSVRSSYQRTPTFPAVETSVAWGLMRKEQNTFPRGWNVAVAGNVKPWLSIVGDVSGTYGSLDWYQGVEWVSSSEHTFLSGARFTGRFVEGRVNPFAQFLGGVSLTRVGLFDSHYGSSTDFAIQPGGGVDFGLSDSIALRMQVDFRTIFAGSNINEFRFTPGIVIRSGRRGF
jgi:hypothetical protein